MKNENRCECPFYEGCAAPICPVAINKKVVWLPGDEICHRKDINFPIARVQRKISRAARNASYYTFDMLNSLSVFTPGIKGIKPEPAKQSFKSREKKWLKTHSSTPLEKFVESD